jgi:hypothetical protein
MVFFKVPLGFVVELKKTHASQLLHEQPAIVLEPLLCPIQNPIPEPGAFMVQPARCGLHGRRFTGFGE